jgi:hypothetical protein
VLPVAILAAAPGFGRSVQHAVRWVSHHTGLPVILVAAVALVLSWRIFKQTLRLALEVLLAVAVLLVATHLGWITW